MPVALVVPPGCHTQANLSWGVPSARRDRHLRPVQPPVAGAGRITTAPPSAPRPLGPATRRSSAFITSAGRNSCGRLGGLFVACHGCVSRAEVAYGLGSGPMVLLPAGLQQGQLGQCLAAAQPADRHQGRQPFLARPRLAVLPMVNRQPRHAHQLAVLGGREPQAMPLGLHGAGRETHALQRFFRLSRRLAQTLPFLGL